MTSPQAELKQTRLLEDASGMHSSEQSVSPPEARINGHRESVVDEKAEQASKAIADALLATEEANKRLTDAIASGKQGTERAGCNQSCLACGFAISCEMRVLPEVWSRGSTVLTVQDAARRACVVVK